MRSMTFQIDDRSTERVIPALVVTITQNDDGSLFFTLNVIGDYTGDLRGFFFDIANETLLGTLAVTNTSAGFTEFQRHDDGVSDLGNGANMKGLLGSDGAAYDAGIEIGTPGIGKDDYQSFSFTLSSSERDLTLDDFANVDIGARLTSVGGVGGAREDSSKLLERTSPAIDAIDDDAGVQEDGNPVCGNVFANDLHVDPVRAVTAVNGSAANVGTGIAGLYGTLHLNADGSYTYLLDNAKPAVQGLAKDELLTESFTYQAVSSSEATASSKDSASLTVTITGTNDAPLIGEQGATGVVFEDGARPAVGQLTVADVDQPQPTPFTWLVDGSSVGRYGSLSLDVGGRWTYALNNGDFANVQPLAQGERVSDSFSVRVTDQIGASDTQVVKVDVVGTNDNPFFLIDPANPTAGTTGGVTEDGAQTATGQLNAFDRDHGAVSHWSVSRSASGYSSDYRVTVDALKITKNGATFLDEGFGGSFTNQQFLPQSLAGGIPTSYQSGGLYSEAGGRLILDGAVAGAIGGVGVSELMAGHLPTLMTDITSDPTRGLKRGDDFTVEARFDLKVPGPGQSYSLLLTDRSTFNVAPADAKLGDDLVGLFVTGRSNGEVVVEFGERDLVQDTITTYGTLTFTPMAGENQIVLRLIHDKTQAGVVHAAFDVLGAGRLTQTFSQTGQIFGTETRELGDDEPGTQVLFGASGRESGDNIQTLDGKYGRLNVDNAGRWTYTLDNTDPDTNALVANQFVTDPFAVRVTDQYGTSSSRQVSVSVQGANDGPVNHSPVIGEQGATGVVFEDGARPAVGTLVAQDVDLGHSLAWSVDSPLIGTYGSFGLTGSGDSASWTYSLNNAAANVQALALGAQVSDTFMVRVADEYGANDTQAVSVTVMGSNDAPFFAFGSVSNGGVTEDAAQQTVSGQLFGSDADLQRPPLHWSVSRSPTGYSSDYRVTVDALKITKNGGLFLDEGFGGTFTNQPFLPQSLAGGVATPYLGGGLYSEAGGRLILDGSVAGTTLGAGIQPLYAAQIATLATDISSDPTRGLKKGDDFMVEARFDLTVPGPGQSYSLALSDRNAGPGVTLDIAKNGDDLVGLFVTGQANGDVVVSFDERDIVQDTISTYGSMTFTPLAGESQIELRLIHDKTQPGIVHGAFDILGSAGTRKFEFAQTGQIFGIETPEPGDDELATQVQVGALGPDHGEYISALAGTYGSLSVDGSGKWTYTLDNTDPDTNALVANQFATDPFAVRVIDEYGTSSSRQVSVTVQGANDGPPPVDNHAPVIAEQGATGVVFEDGARPAVGQLTATDVDPGHVLSWWLDAPPPLIGTYGTLSLTGTGDTRSWTYSLNNGAFNVQALAQGETVSDNFTVRAIDQFGASDTQVVTVTVIGSNDFPFTTPASQTAGSVVEDDALLRTASGQIFGVDNDHNSTLHWSADASPTGYSSDYRFEAEALRITRNGELVFNDEFDDGIAPPSTPAPAPLSYGITGALSETGGVLVLDGSLAGAVTGTATPDLTAGNLATLNTSSDPADLVNGLKKHHDFKVEATFNLIEPDAGEGYGLALTDRVSGPGVNPAITQLGDDTPSLHVVRAADGSLAVRFHDRDFVRDAITEYATLAFTPAPGENQIVLRFEHAAGTGTVQASFDLLKDGVWARTVSFSEPGYLYGSDTPHTGDDEVWTRAQIVSFGPDGESNAVAGKYGSFSVDGTGRWTYALDNADPDTNALMQGQSATELFSARGVDEYGFSTFRQVSIAVQGADDPVPLIGMSDPVDLHG